MSMLSDYKVITPIAVNDIENAVDFYANVLGLKPVEKNIAGHLFDCGGGLIGLHQSPTAGSGQATCAWWTVDDVEGIVEDLKSRGVEFEQNYDLPHVEQHGDVYVMGKTERAAWFRDPDGNTLGLGNF